MAEPVHEQSREAANLLVAARDRGEPISEADLRDSLGVGPIDLDRILDQLRVEGMASQVAPQEWSAPEEEEPLRVRAPRAEESEEESEEEAGEDVVVSPAGAPQAWAGAVPWLTGQPTVKLTPGVADALDAPAIGALVKAGIAECAARGEPFTMEVSE